MGHGTPEAQPAIVSPPAGIGPPPRLDDATFFDRAVGVRIYPGRGEAVVFQPTGHRREAEHIPGVAHAPERAAREAARRARTMVRRLVGEYRLGRLFTLTIARQTTGDDRAVVVAMVAAFARRLKRDLPSWKWVMVPEWHPRGHGWHVHIASSHYVPKARLAELWGHGFVDARLIRPKGARTRRDAARTVATYLAKYIAKDVEEAPREPGQHRYYRPQGMPITVVEAECMGSEVAAVVAAAIGPVRWWWASWLDESSEVPVRVMVYRSG